MPSINLGDGIPPEFFSRSGLSRGKYVPTALALLIHLLAALPFLTQTPVRPGDTALVVQIMLEPERPPTEAPPTPRDIFPSQPAPHLAPAPLNSLPSHRKTAATQIVQTDMSSGDQTSAKPMTDEIVSDSTTAIANNQGHVSHQDLMQNYAAQIWDLIQSHRPTKIRWTGTTTLQFALSKSGTLLTAEIIQSSGREFLDQVALKTIQESAPFPVPPIGAEDADLVFTIPFQFR